MTAPAAIRSLIVVALSVTSASAQAGVCMPLTVQKESPYHFIMSLAEALSYAKAGLDRTGPSALETDASGFKVLLGFKLGKADFECARSQVFPYTTSSSKAIQGSAEGTAKVFAILADLHQRSVSEQTAFMDSIAAGTLKPGTFTERQAELAASYDEAWKHLISMVILGTYALVAVEPTTGRMSRLSLTRGQRDEILQKLRSTFGQEITRGMKAGQTSLVAAASALYQVVGDPKRQLREGK